MEDETERLLAQMMGLGNQRLRIFEDHGAQLHIARRIDSVDVAEARRHREMAERRERVVGLQHVFGLGVEIGIADVAFAYLMADAVFLAAGDAEFDFQAHAEWGHALQDAGADFQVLAQRLGRQVEHVGGEQRLAGLLEMFFALFQQAFDPGHQLLVGMIGVENDADAIFRGQQMNVLRRGGRAQDARAVRIGNALAAEEARAAVGHLDDDVRFRLGSGLQHRIDAVGADDIDGGQRVAALFAGRQQLQIFRAGHDAGAQSLCHFVLIFRFAASLTLPPVPRQKHWLRAMSRALKTVR